MFAEFNAYMFEPPEPESDPESANLVFLSLQQNGKIFFLPFIFVSRPLYILDF